MKNKQTFPNGTLTAQLDKSLNGTTRGNLAFILNKSPSYLWSNPLAKMLTKNNTDKKVQWQFNTVSPGAMASAGAAPKAPAPPAGGGGGAKPPAGPPAAAGGGAPKPAGGAPPSAGGGKPPAPSGGG